MLKSRGELAQLISELPEFFEMSRSKGIAKGENLKVEDRVEFIKIAEYQLP